MKTSMFLMFLVTATAMADGYDCRVGKSNRDPSPIQFSLSEKDGNKKIVPLGSGYFSAEISFYESSLFISVLNKKSGAIIYRADNFSSEISSAELASLKFYYSCQMRHI